MTNHPTDAPPTGMELLDRDPAPPPRRLPWEPILGLLLVLGIAGAGLWQWTSAGTQHAAYRTALQAETAQDWDRALVAYQQAGSYSDAPIRAGNVAATVRERDTAYATAAGAMQKGDWAALLPALVPLKRLAPTYRDTPRFVQAVETGLYTPALSGTVALRPSAQPPGLYTYRPGGWRWLAGSDVHSQIETRCPNGDWLLDVALPPPPGATPLPTPLTDASNTVRLAGRRLALVSTDGTARQLLDPTLNSWESYLCDGGQVWGRSFQQRGNSGSGNQVYMPIYTNTRQSLNMTQAQVPMLPGPDWFFGLVATNGRHVLLVDTTDLNPVNPQIGLAVADPDGSRLQALGTFSGTLQVNSFSPDGRWLLVMLNHRIAMPPEQQQQRVLLFDLSSAHAPQILAEVQRDGVNTDNVNYLYAGFFNRPPYQDRITLFRYGTAPLIRLITPDGSAPDQIYRLPTPFYLNSFPAIDRNSGQFLLEGKTANPSQDEAPNSIALLTPPDTVALFASPVLAKQRIEVVAIRAGHFQYLVGEDVNYRIGSTQSVGVYSMALTDLGKTPLTPTLIYTGTRTITVSQYLNSWHAGAKWLAYATPSGELHARRYDGTGDVLLERGVSGFAQPYAYLTEDDQ